MSETLPILVVSAILANLVLALVIIRGIDSLRLELLRITRKLEQISPNESQFRIEAKDSLLGRRVKYRAEAQIPAVLTTRQGRIPVQVNDLSETGALLHCPNLTLEVEDEGSIEFEIGDGSKISSDVRVVRITDEGQYGVCFEGLTLETKVRVREYIQRHFGGSLTDDIRPV